ncbi:hypothetical protein A79E_1755 [Klebsiella pneumoniae subsp. pneumoniae 1084]|nr:hypothetical protein A79E_1755 [Klebsiella pneumoniae subsp. pneumoniae 1084]
MKEGGYSKKVDIKTTIIAFVINYLFFIYQCHYILVIIMDMIFSICICCFYLLQLRHYHCG